MALQLTAFFCQMDDHIGVTVPSNSCKSAIDCTRFSGCCLARACLHKEYANSCLLLKDSLRWNVKETYSTLPYIFKTTMAKKRESFHLFFCKLYSDIWHSRTCNKCSGTVIVILLTCNYLSNKGEKQTNKQRVSPEAHLVKINSLSGK